MTYAENIFIIVKMIAFELLSPVNALFIFIRLLSLTELSFLLFLSMLFNDINGSLNFLFYA